MHTITANHAINAPTQLTADWNLAQDLFNAEISASAGTQDVMASVARITKRIRFLETGNQGEPCDYPHETPDEVLLAQDALLSQDWDDPEELDHYMDQIEGDLQWAIEHQEALMAPACTAGEAMQA